MTKFEKAIIYYCSPTLKRKKPACLFSCEFHFHYNHFQTLVALLKIQGFCLSVVSIRQKHGLFLLYYPEQLNAYLEKSEIYTYLKQLGYPSKKPNFPYCPLAIEYLKNKMLYTPEFPHEIGLFLGYPLEDVLGFILQRGQNYKINGLWKVYGNEEAAKRQFEAFTSCRKQLWEKVEAGETFEDILEDNKSPAVK